MDVDITCLTDSVSSESSISAITPSTPAAVPLSMSLIAAAVGASMLIFKSSYAAGTSAQNSLKMIFQPCHLDRFS